MLLDRIEAVNSQQLFGNQNVTFGTTEPATADKVNNALWFEPGSLFPQPWIWDSTNAAWFSSPYQISFEVTFTASKLFKENALYFYNTTSNRTKIIRAEMLLINTSTSVAHSASNNYFFTLFRMTSGVPLVYTQIFSFTTTSQTMAANGSVRIAESVNQVLPGNSWGWRLNAGRTGTPTDILVNTIFTFQSARP